MSKSVFRILLFCVLIRMTLLVLIFEFHFEPIERFTTGGDAEGYIQLATNIIEKQTFCFFEGSATAFRMPGYPLFLALFHWGSLGFLPALILQILLDTASTFCVYRIAKVIPSLPWSAEAAALTYTVNPFIILFSVSFLTETLTIFLITHAILFLLKKPFSIRANLTSVFMLGLGLYTKPNLFMVIIFLLTVMVVYDVVVQKSWKMGARSFLLSCMVLGLMFSPWIIRNHLVFNTFIPLTTSDGSNLYGGNNSYADGGYVSDAPYVLKNMNEIESNRILTQRAITWITQHPSSFLRLIFLKAYRFFWPLSLGSSGVIEVPLLLSLLLLGLVIFFYGTVFIGIAHFCRQNKIWEVIVLTVPITALLVSSSISFGAARFALLAFSSLAVCFADGLFSILTRSSLRPYFEKTVTILKRSKIMG